MKATQIVLFTFGGLAAASGTPLPAAAQGASCPGSERPVIRPTFNFSCNCMLARDSGGVDHWTFRSEPRVDRADDDATVHAGDAIVMADQQPITSDDGGAAFSRLFEGRSVALTVRRGNRLLVARVTPKRGCESNEAVRAPSPDVGPPGGGLVTRGYLGLGLSTRATVEAPAGGPAVWHFEEPPVVVGIAAGSPAERAGLRIGDSVTAVDGHPITSDDAGRRFGAALPGEILRLEVRRGGAMLRVAVEVGDREVALVRIEGSRVEVTGPAHVEHIGNRTILRAEGGRVTVVVFP